MSGENVQKALDHLEQDWDRIIEQLKDLVRIPGVSANPAPDADLQRSAEAVKAVLEDAGLDNCEVISFPGGHPFAYGEWLGAEGAPTVLLYGHHDVMPPGRPEKWISPAFEPEVREGRLFGRGAADDKAGIMMHVAACASYLKAHGKLPVNVKFMVEGEEEAGSASMEAFLAKYRERLAADVVVLTDTANLEAGLPSLTTSLRGNGTVDIEVRALEHPLHSGMWGGPVPDPVIALSKAIGLMLDDDGRPAIEGLWDDVRPLTEKERAEMEKLPFDDAGFRSMVDMVEGARLVGDPEMPAWGRIYRQPSITVIAFEAHPFEGSTNQIIESAKARISLRLVPDRDPEKAMDAVVRHFERHVPWGLQVTAKKGHGAPAWMTEIDHPAFAAASRALGRGFGKDAAFIGCGGSIPFVGPFVESLGGVPAILMGVEDPKCNAHSENESVILEDLKNGIRSAIHLYDELGRMG